MRLLPVIASIVLCGGSVGADPARADDAFRIGLAVPNQTFYAPVFAAQELGYFKAAGVDVEIVEYRGGAAAQEALAAGAADMITAFPPGTALVVSKGVKTKMVSTIAARVYGWHLLVNTASPIKAPADLIGKKIGITTKASTSDLLAMWSAEQIGGKVQTIPVGGAAMVPSLKSNQVDAISLFASPSLRLLASGEARSITDYAAKIPPIIAEAWAASQDAIDKQPDKVRAVLAGFYKALDYMRKNREWGLNFIKQRTGETDDKINAIVYEVETLNQSTDGATEEKWITDSLNMSAQAWNMPEIAKVKPADIYTGQFVPVKF